MSHFVQLTLSISLGYLIPSIFESIHLSFNSRQKPQLHIRNQFLICFSNLILAIIAGNIGIWIKLNIVKNSCNSNDDTLIQFLFHTILVDIGFYCGHLLLHKVHFLKKYHELHHSKVKPIGFDFFYLHPMDNILSLLIPYTIAQLIPAISIDLLLKWLFLQILFNTLVHITDLNFQHLEHHHGKDNSYGTGVVVDYFLGSENSYLDSKLAEWTGLSLVFYILHWGEVTVYVKLYVSLFVLFSLYYITVRYLSQSTFLRQIIWKFLYNFASARLNKLPKSDEINFLNWGYYETDAFNQFNNGDKEAFRKKLYDVMVSDLNTNDCVLEIGFGRGGGILYLYQIKHFINVYGVDLSPVHVKRCRHILNDIIDHDNCINKICEGNAMYLDSKMHFDNKYDVVINVESSHCYTDFYLFVSQVHRVLTQNGLFNICDFRTVSEWNEIETFFTNSPNWEMKQNIDITTNVLQSAKLTETNTINTMKKCMPFIIHGLLYHVILAENSIVHKAFVDGTSQYKLLRLKAIK